MKHLLTLVFGFFFILTCKGQELQTIKLNEPQKDRGFSVMQAFEKRHSERVWADKELSLQDLSDLLWAANGINRPETGKRTAPSSMNKQDIDVYVCMARGTYLYDAKAHELKPVTAIDVRAEVAADQKEIAKAPVTLVMVTNYPRLSDSKNALISGAIDGGIVSENISIFCAGVGLATVPRTWMNKENLRSYLKLQEGQELIINNPVGYKK